MGLDMYAYTATQANAGYDDQRELAYWRKHPNLHGWMQKLWDRKGRPGIPADVSEPMFNGVEVELTWEDLDELEQAVRHRQLPATSGFFFGNHADDHYYESDMAFIGKARAELFMGLKVFYNSSW
jgi:hypothetical protein